ncbi:MAG TPA: IscS subfamily cysteine desulfurase [Saprospiraceae bacterium]|nr:IscS subfamily cysteine desulfurase [Saprospiraceae bacterium]
MTKLIRKAMENKNKLIYLDYNSTTPVDRRVVDAMLPYFYDHPGNAASHHHAYGWAAEDAVDQARKQVADLINVSAKELVFTSGATESNNLAIKGVFQTYQSKGKHIVTVKTEHKAVLDACLAVEKMGGEVTYLEVDEEGLVNLDLLAEAIRPDTVLVSIMWANNETGVIQPMEAIGKVCAEQNTLLMSDATQAVGKIPIFPKEAGVHLLSCSAHKLYGPKGVGALYVSNRQPRVKIGAQIVGGGHEEGMRSGTLNVPGIVGFGKSAALAKTEMAKEAERLAKLRNRLETALLELPEVYRNGPASPRLPQVSNLSFKYIKGEALMMAFKEELAVSSGSACTSANPDPSHVLLSMGISENMAEAALRFSLGRFTTTEQIDRSIEVVKKAVAKVRAESPAWQLFQDGVDLAPMGWA